MGGTRWWLGKKKKKKKKGKKVKGKNGRQDKTGAE